MGNDGGSIPSRRELVKEAARNPTASELKESQGEKQQYCWTTDPISQKPLAQPVVSDSSGKLYNKDTILEYLVGGGHEEDVKALTSSTIKSLKDVVEVKFEVDTGATIKSNGNAQHATWICPITNDRLGPGSGAVYLVPCGHVFSGRAIKEISGEKCFTCETEFASNDIIPILPTSDTDIARLSLRIKTLQEKGLTHALKKASSGGKKRKKRDLEPGFNGETSLTKSKSTPLPLQSQAGTLVQDHLTETDSDRIRSAATASLTAKVLQEQEVSKKRKAESENVQSLFSRKSSKPANSTSSDFMTRGFSIPASSKR